MMAFRRTTSALPIDIEEVQVGGVESWDPWAEFEVLQARIDALIEAFAARFPGLPVARKLGFFPQCDLFEREDACVVRVALPGVLEEDVEIAFERGMLVVRGERDVPPAAAAARPILRELRDGYFERRIRIPFEVAADRIEAEFADGILSVILRKASGEKP